MFLSLRMAAGAFDAALLPATLIIFKAVNFHHYTVDAIIWRRRRRPATA